MGVTEASFISSGRDPSARDRLMILVIDGARLSTRDLRRKPGIGSRQEDFDGSYFIRSTFMSTLTGSKDDNRCTGVVASSASREAGARDS